MGGNPIERRWHGKHAMSEGIQRLLIIVKCTYSNRKILNKYSEI